MSAISVLYSDKENKQDEYTKVKDITMYKTACPNCGWKNSLKVMAHYCPKCGKDLKVMVFVDNNGMSESSECIGGFDLSK